MMPDQTAMLGTSDDLAQRRRAEFRVTSIDLAFGAGLPTEPFHAPGFALPSALVFSHDHDRLVVMVGGGESDKTVDSALAYGLAHAGDLDLVLVLPVGQHAATAARSVFLDRKIRLFTHDAYETTLLVLPRRRAVFEALRARGEALGLGNHPLNPGQAGWVSDLVAWADSNQDLQAEHRPHYLAWHCDGRRLLTIKASGDGLLVVAGVARVNPGPEHRPAARELITATLEPYPQATMQEEIWTCIAERLSWVDDGHREHRLRSVLKRQWSTLGFQGGVPLREFPARRADGSAAFIDLLQLDYNGVLHIVETKIQHDEFLVLQGLDYWMWATANRDLLAAYFEAEIKDIHVDYMVGELPNSTAPGTGVLSPYAPAQLEALDVSITWEVHLLTGWTGQERLRQPLGRRVVPSWPVVARRPSGPSYVAALQAHLIAGSGGKLIRRVYHRSDRAGLHPDAHAAYDDLLRRDLLHKHVANVRSSQAFALNVFGGMDETTVVKVLRRLGLDAVSAQPPDLEYVDPWDRLRERTSGHPYQTQVDVVLRGETADETKVVALIEVKLSEADFGRCASYESHESVVCQQPGPFGGEAKACPVLREPDESTPGRRYLDVLTLPATEPTADAGCSFRLGVYQPMRNLALAEVLLADRESDAVTLALFAPGAYAAMWRRWAEAKAALESPRVPLRDLTLEDVLEDLDPERAAYLSARYLLSTRAAA
jgi:hypothetical protein